jgi:hypothetical protein
VGLVSSVALRGGDTAVLVWNGAVWAMSGTALQRVAGFNNQLASNGGQRLPSGLIMQWGGVSGTTGALSGTGAAEVFVSGTFPLAFPTACTFIGASPNDVLGMAFQEQAFAVADSQSTFTVNLQCRQASTAMSARWFALGY